MVDVKNLNIWKNKKQSNDIEKKFLNTNIAELELSVRAFNCLKRANCNSFVQ